jgi:hypothetical protein
VAAWGEGGPATGLAAGQPLTPCPAIAYRFPGVAPGKAAHGLRCFAELQDMYCKSMFYLNLRPRTAADYAAILTDFMPLIGPTPVARLTRQPLRKLYEALVRRHGLASGNARMRVLSVVLSFGVEMEWLQVNPLYRFAYRPTPGRIRVASEAEIAALRAAALAMPEGPRHDAAGLIMASAFLGQRRADTCELSLAQYRDGLFHLDQQKRGRHVEVRAVDELVAALDAMLAAFQARWGNLDQRFRELKLARPRAWFRHMAETPLLWSQDTGLPLDKYSATRLFGRVRAVAALHEPAVAGLRLADFRDFMVTELFRAGCSDTEVAAIAGHGEGSIAMKRRHYFERHDNVLARSGAAKLAARRRAMAGGGS